MTLGFPEMIVMVALGFTGMAIPIATIVLLVLIYRRLSELRLQIEQLIERGK